MTYLHIVLVALVQGITEFLPISSSAHLILLPYVTGLDDQGQVIDVAAHLGTLAAVVLYFWTDIADAIRGLPNLLRGRVDGWPEFLALCLVVATIPAMIAGLVLELTGLDAALRSVTVIGWTTLGFGLVLWWADRTGSQDRVTRDWTLRHALVMGLWQAVALIPGTSRSGITITVARRLGYARADAARLSMLMSIPVTFATVALLAGEVAINLDGAAARDGAIVAVLSFVSALAALAFMMRLLRSVSFTPYVVYRVLLGLVLLAIAYA